MQQVARAAVCALVAACALACTSVASAAPALPTQGVYEWCDTSSTPDACARRLQWIGMAGFRAVDNGSVFDNLTEQAVRDYAQAASAAGVRVIWPLNALQFQYADPNGANLLGAYRDLAAHCGCSDNQGLLAYLIGVLRSLPSTWGYYVADEPQPGDHDQLAAFVSRIAAVDPDHPRLIMGCGICAGGPDANVAWLADLDIALGSDAYPVYGGPPNPIGAYFGVKQNVAGLDRAAGGRGRRQVVALQAWRVGDSALDSQSAGLDAAAAAATRFPTREEIEAQRNAAIENSHPDLILWFTLTQVIGWEPGQNHTGWSDPPDPAQRTASLIGGAFAPLPGARAASARRRPLARFTIRRGSRSRFVADGGRSQARGGRIVRYVWTLNGRRVARGGSRRIVFHVGRGRVQRLVLTVTDDRGASAAAQRRFMTR
jgi:hypothetical protein